MPTSACPIPTYPRWLGGSGVLPFVLLAILTWVPGSHTAWTTQALLAYGAVILSFVGALHWGLAMSMQPSQRASNGRLYVGSVVPALLAWLALLLPPVWAVAILVAGLWGHYAQDRRLARVVELPDWYLPLRLALTGFASLALILAWPRLIRSPPAMDWFVCPLPRPAHTQQESFPPSRFAALRRALRADPARYARTRNHLHGAVTALSPYVTHGLLPADELFVLWRRRLCLGLRDKLLGELAWREFFHHVWHHRGEGILHDLGPGLPGVRYAVQLPVDLRQAATGVPVIDATVRRLYRTGWLHNHQRMWLASYTVHLRKVHWRVGADWMYGHLLDGDLASNHLSWQWVAGTFSRKPYLFNADNVRRYAPELSSGATAVDRTYAELEEIAFTGTDVGPEDNRPSPLEEPALFDRPPGWHASDSLPEWRDGWTAIVHPWSLEGRVPGIRQVGVLHTGFHRRFPWSARRWAFVLGGMHRICDEIHLDDLIEVAGALAPPERLLAVMTLNPGYREGLTLAVGGCLAPPPHRAAGAGGMSAVLQRLAEGPVPAQPQSLCHMAGIGPARAALRTDCTRDA